MKTIPLSQLTLLEKCLGMIGSENNGEAANAGRMATAILKKHDFSWGELLRKQVGVVSTFGNSVDDGPEAATDVIASTNTYIQKCLDALRGKDLGNFSNYIRSLDEQWTRDRYLSVDQRRALFGAYKRNG